MSAPATASVQKQAQTVEASPNGVSLLDQVLDATQRKVAANLRDTAGRFASAIELATDHLERSLVISLGINQLRALLSDDVMAKYIIPLMNSPLGFLTDKDPNRPSRNNPKPEPYPIPVVREAVIAALLAGFRLVGNEFNIIGGRIMGVQAGWRRKVQDSPGVSNPEVVVGQPIVKDGIAQVRVAARVMLDGNVVQLMDHESKPGRLFHIAIRDTDGIDLWKGKAERRAWKALWERLQARHLPLPDEDEEQGPAQAAAPPAAAPAPAPASKAERLADKVGAPAEAPESQSQSSAPFDSDGAIAATEAENDIAGRIRAITTPGESNAVGADLMRCHAVLGEERYQVLLKQLQAKNRELQGKGGAKTATMF